MADSILEKKILLILPYGSVGGMERLAKTFYDYYKEQGYLVKAVKFIKLKGDIINFGDDELFLSSKDFYSMSFFTRYLFYTKVPLLLRGIIKKHGFTHSIAFGDMANLFSSLTFTQEFKIGSVHALKSVELSSASPFNHLIRLGYRSSYKNLNKLVCISNSIKEDLITNCAYRFSNLEVIYNPHNIDTIVKLSEEKLVGEEEQQLFRGQTILFLGRLSIQKAPWHLIQAFKLVNEALPEVKLIFIGDGDSEIADYLTKQVKRLALSENVFFLGRKSNPYQYLKRASCLALTSHYEGTPNVIVEAIALNIPTISSYCTNGIIELMSLNENLTYGNQDILRIEGGMVTPNFYHGRLAIPHKIENDASDNERLFAKALMTVLGDLKNGNELVIKRDDLLKKFDLQTVANRYLN